MYKMCFVDSPNCKLCNRDRETVEHILLYCPSISDLRNHLVHNVDKCYNDHQTPFEERTFSIKTLLHQQHSDPHTRYEIKKAVIKFIDNIPIDI